MIYQGWGGHKHQQAVTEMTNDYNLRGDEDDIEEVLELVPEGMTNEELLELEQERIAEEDMREEETAGEEKEAPRKFNEVFSRSFCQFQQAP